MSNNTRLAELMNYITIDTTSGTQLQVSGSVKQTSVTSALMKAGSTGILLAAVAGTDYLTSVGISNLTATGTPSSTTYLRGDNTWATVSGGASSVSTLTDVVLTSVANGDVLQYNSSTSKWVNAVVSGGSGVTLDTAQTITGVKIFKGSSTNETSTFNANLLSSSGWGTATGWTGDYTNGWTVVGAGSSTMTNTLAATGGAFYYISVTATVSATVSLNITFGGTSNTITFLSGTSTQTATAYATSSASLVLNGTSFNGTITSISIVTKASTLNPTITFSSSAGLNPIEIRTDAVSSGNNISIGYLAGRNNYTGTSNIALGASALITNQIGYDNIAIGSNALFSLGKGNANIAIGTGALYYNLTGTNSVAIGLNAGNRYTGGNSTYVGNISGQNLLSGAFNVALGHGALTGSATVANNTGGSNTAIGVYALYGASSGGFNTAIGYTAATAITTGSDNIAIGAYTLDKSTTTASTIAIGREAGRYISGGTVGATSVFNSIFIGYRAYPLADTNTNQIVIGYTTVGLGSNTTSIGNSSTVDTAIYGNLLLGNTTTGGAFKLSVTGTTKKTGTTATDFPTLGAELGAVTASGTNWTLAGTNLNVGGYTHTTGSTVALTTTFAPTASTYYYLTYTVTGRTAGSFGISVGGASPPAINGISSTGSWTVLTTSTSVLTITPTSTFDGTVVLSIKAITAVSSALQTFANSSGTSMLDIRASSFTGNSFIGYQAGQQNTNGINNTLVGYQAGAVTSSSYDNTFIGFQSGYICNTGDNNVAIGSLSGTSLTTGYFNTFIGAKSGQLSSTTVGNTIIGFQAGVTQTSGLNNVYVGYQSGQNVNSQDSNTFIGTYSGQNLTTGGGNVFIGYTAGGLTGAGTSLTNATNSILIGWRPRALAASQTNQIVIGYDVAGLGSNTTVLGNSSTTLTALYGAVITGGTSADASAQLQIDSTTKGVLFPRMTTTQKNAIATPAAGLVVYDTTLGKLCVRTASAWETITSA